MARALVMGTPRHRNFIAVDEAVWSSKRPNWNAWGRGVRLRPSMSEWLSVTSPRLSMINQNTKMSVRAARCFKPGHGVMRKKLKLPSHVCC